MILSSFHTIEGHNNNSGYYDFAFIIDSQVLSMPNPINGIVNFDAVQLAEGASFFMGYATLNTLSLGDESKYTAHGMNCPTELVGSCPIVNNNNLQLFTTMTSYRFVLLCRDNNNKWFVLGEPNNGLLFTFKRNGPFLDFKFSATYSHVSWQASGDVLIDGSIISTGNGNNSGGGEGGVVDIQNSIGENIASVTAPGQYNVPDTNVRIKDTAGNLLSNNSIKAASGAIDLTAPDGEVELLDSVGGASLGDMAVKSGANASIVAPIATMVVNGVVFTTIKSGEEKEYSLTDQNNNPIIANVVGNQVTINMPDNSFFNYCNSDM